MERKKNKIIYLSQVNDTPSLSFGQSSWRRLKKNKGAMIGLFMIMLAILLAIFCYLIAPDPSPFADREILEIGGEKPGFTKDFLLVKKTNPQQAGLFSVIVSGKPDRFDHIPINSHENKGDSIIVEKFVDEAVSDRLAFHKNQLAEKPVIRKKFYVGT